MTTRKEISNLIENYLNNAIDSTEESELLKLMGENSLIKEEFILRQKIDSAIKKKEVMDLREQLKSLFNQKDNELLAEEPKPVYKISWYQLAAGFVVLLGLGFILASQLGNSSSQDDYSVRIHEGLNNNNNQNNDLYVKEYIEKNTTVKKDYPEDIKYQSNHKNIELMNRQEIILADNFAESQYFESLIVSYRSHEIKILKPKPSESYNFGSEIQYSWNNSLGDSLTLRIYNNKEEIIFSSKALEGSIFREKLQSGLYYWKLESDEDLIYMNKFFIR